ncbi:MAG: sugar ABC transporter permease, partial [Enterococcus sp.]|uniref:carbohydrate ABC transporter permease n=1 Tax=Enterococcus sp. TaxID=35783 RepID=UPI002650F0F9|nr:sugar ABC transporter permease [Enterococcus sp.]
MGVLRDKKAFFVFLMPGLLFYLLSVFYPITESLRLSFIKWNGITPQQFVGLDNYKRLFQDPVFYKALINTLIYLVIVVIIQLSIGFLFAV